MSRSRILSIIGYGITACAFLVILVWGLVNTVGGDEGFGIVSFWLVIPSVSLVGGFILGYSGAKMKWLYPFIFGVCASIITSLIYSFQAINILYALFSFAPALLGMGIGHILMKKQDYLIMAVSASVFSVFWLFLCNVIDFLNDANELTMIIVFAVVAIGIALLFSQKYLKQKDRSTSKKTVHVALTALLLLTLMIGIFYLAIIILLSFGQH